MDAQAPINADWLALGASIQDRKRELTDCYLLCSERFRQQDAGYRGALRLHRSFCDTLGGALDSALCNAYPANDTTNLFYSTPNANDHELPIAIRPKPRRLVGEERAQVVECCQRILAFLDHPMVKRYAPKERAKVIVEVVEWTKRM